MLIFFSSHDDIYELMAMTAYELTLAYDAYIMTL